MKNTATKILLNISFGLGSILGIYLYTPTLNLIFKGSFLKTTLNAMHFSSPWEALIMLFSLLFILGVFLNLLIKWIKFNSTDETVKITLFFTLKMMAIGFVFPYIFISTAWVIVMILVKVFLMK